uniref:Uncharacterized protein n=1 Tax=Arundo donax TaxID=35708 RepID=A0A0A9AQJ3_ARUDO
MFVRECTFFYPGVRQSQLDLSLLFSVEDKLFSSGIDIGKVRLALALTITKSFCSFSFLRSIFSKHLRGQLNIRSVACPYFYMQAAADLPLHFYSCRA